MRAGLLHCFKVRQPGNANMPEVARRKVVLALPKGTVIMPATCVVTQSSTVIHVRTQHALRPIKALYARMVSERELRASRGFDLSGWCRSPGRLCNIAGMQVVVITGCGSGLGKALARSFHQQAAFGGKPSGFRVFASDLNLQSIQDLKLEGIDTMQMDVTKIESVQQAVDHVEQEAGRIDVLVCNAGIVTIAPLIEEDLSEIQAVWNVNT